jgi:predicted lactoylglutathione lyase
VQVLNALSVESREEVDEWVEKALTAGGREAKPARDLGFMYSRDVEDPDGHIWEVLWMEPSAIENGPS